MDSDFAKGFVEPGLVEQARSLGAAGAGHAESSRAQLPSPPEQSPAANSDALDENRPILTESERHQVLVAWNATVAPIPDCGVHRFFEEQAARTPDAVAVDDGHRRMTYRELDRQSNRLAQQLRRRGIAAETLVGIYLDRSLESVVAVLAVWKAGGAYVPLDPRVPGPRLAFVVDDTAVRVIVSDPRTPKGVLAERADLTFVDVHSEDLGGHIDDEQAPGAATNDRCGGDRLAYVLHTSGSTGKPKGVAITHRSTVNLIRSEQQITGFSQTDVMLAVTTLTFDISVMELMLPLSTGGTVRVVGSDTVMDGQWLNDVIEQSNVTYVQTTPSLWRMFVQTGWTGSPKVTGIAGGEPLPRDLADDLLDRLALLWDMYGPTETTIYSTAGRVERGTRIHVGRSIANTRAYILDSTRQPVPIGIVGDLYLGGAGVARGYWEQPELTAERFLPDPFSADPGARIYFTGDLARFLPNGNIELIGRSDRQVKLRGLRIELGEIESVLLQHPAVSNAAVIGREDASRDLRLVCYYASRPERPADVASLRAYLRERLPEYMVPTAFVELVSLPLTPSGKVDRQSLPTVEGDAPRGGDSAAPRDPLETGIAAIWSRILRIEKVGLNDQFFDLGGHSIQAVQMLAEVERAFGDAPPLRVVLEGMTLAQLATAIREKRDRHAHVKMRLLDSGSTEKVDCCRPPLLVAPSVFGETGDWRQLFAETSGGRRVYGIEIEGSEPYWSQSPGLEDIAARCIASIQNDVLERPFHLAGYSFGAWLAYEMAVQLERAGMRPRSVTIVDSAWIGTKRSWSEQLLVDLPSMIGNFPRWLVERVDRGAIGRLLTKIRRQAGQRIFTLATPAPADDPHFADAASYAHELFNLKHLPEHLQRRLVLGLRAQAIYQPGRYSGRLAYVQSKVRPLIHQSVSTGGWGAFAAGPLEDHTIPRSHVYAMSTGAQLRTVLADVMRRADAESGSPSATS